MVRIGPHGHSGTGTNEIWRIRGRWAACRGWTTGWLSSPGRAAGHRPRHCDGTGAGWSLDCCGRPSSGAGQIAGAGVLLRRRCHHGPWRYGAPRRVRRDRRGVGAERGRPGRIQLQTDQTGWWPTRGTPYVDGDDPQHPAQTMGALPSGESRARSWSHVSYWKPSVMEQQPRLAHRHHDDGGLPDRARLQRLLGLQSGHRALLRRSGHRNGTVRCGGQLPGTAQGCHDGRGHHRGRSTWLQDDRRAEAIGAAAVYLAGQAARTLTGTVQYSLDLLEEIGYSIDASGADAPS